jgi:Tat protein secretion system quality control protein TatD with DNase activity
MTKEKGFIHIVIVVAVLFVGIIGYFVWWEFFDDDGPDNFDIAFQEFRLPENCTGQLFDSHTHMDDSDLPTALSQRMQENGVSCAAIFVQMNEDNYEEDIELFYDDLGDAPGAFIPFLDVVRDNQTTVSREYLEMIDKQLMGQYKGFGEFALYRDELRGADLTADPWNTIFEFAGEHDKFVMIHIGMDPADLKGLKAAMTNFPDTKFLVHGFELGGAGYAQLLKTYPNFYFTLDTATFMKEPGPQAHYMYPNNGGSSKQFLSQYPQHKEALIQYAKSEYTQVILAAPERVKWGTDASFEWHTDHEVYTNLIEFSQEFIESLPKEVQSKYAHENAQRLFK